MESSQRKKQVYRFGVGVAEGNGQMDRLLGGKGAGLAEMTLLQLPVPPGFTITTEVCRDYYRLGKLPDDLEEEIDLAVQWLEETTGKSFGSENNPLLVSVRSGAPISMPGMMDTVLNVGLTDLAVAGLAERTQSILFALDSYCRLMQMFGSVVLNIPRKAFTDAAVSTASPAAGADGDSDTERLRALVDRYQAVYPQYTGCAFPQDSRVQLRLAIESVIKSWNCERAKFYRSVNGIPEDLGTAVTVQAMVFGNMGPDSGTGVGFTRNPSTGANVMFAEFIPNAQGEDIVAGIRTPVPISELERTSPDVYEQLLTITRRLEQHYRDVQDFEFTLERGVLYLLQTRSAKRTAQAAVRIAVDLAEEGLITRVDAISRVSALSVAEILCTQLDLGPVAPSALTTGLPGSSGAAVGRIALSAASAVRMSLQGAPVILVTEETTADDIHGMAASQGFLTARGGATSHAAVVARGMGKCCITAAHDIEFHPNGLAVTIGSQSLCEGDWLSMDGSNGNVFSGQHLKREASADNPALNTLLSWALEERLCDVRANADTPADVAKAKEAGAAGIGLCRTEHMFFDKGRLPHVRSMILASSKEERSRALDVLQPMQQADFEELFRAMAPQPVTIRLLDPPLHEFLPDMDEVSSELTSARKAEDWERCAELELTRRRIASLAESNPMMGHRGCRLSLTYPEILEMQVRAILQAAVTVRRAGLEPAPEIMVPLIASEEEMAELAQMINDTATEVERETGAKIPYKLGTMIELPRAALCAASISKHVSFISFGTNDLTQMTYGFSRDDASRFLQTYLQRGILKVDPFVSIDVEGVGALMETAIHRARSANPTVKIGVCGEHGGDPTSIHFFKKIGVDYVSCSPARIAIAQLAAAQTIPLLPRTANPEEKQTRNLDSPQTEPVHDVPQPSKRISAENRTSLDTIQCDLVSARD